jgi:DNA-binding transcriptional MerR regulator
MRQLPEVQTGSDEPLYNIGVVARMTNLSMATLRAWERRYGFPESKRTSGGHRLYSERDVLRLQWVKARIDEGMQTKQAINALRYQEETGRFITPRDEVIAEGVRLDDELFLSNFKERLLNDVLRLDLQSADGLLGQALALTSPEDLILNLIAPVMASIGQAWEEGQISVATEHLSTNFFRQRLLMWMLSGPPPQPIPPIVLACAPEEWHEGSLLILGALLRRRRWPVAYIGQSVPLSDLAVFVRDLKPSAVVMVAMMEKAAQNLAEWPRWLPDAAERGIPIFGFGGRIFVREPEWQKRVKGHYLGDTLREGLENLERLLR